MKFIFCSEPFQPLEPDYVYRGEAETVRQKGFEFELFSFEDLDENKIGSAFRNIKPFKQKETAIYRGWMLKPEKYRILYDELKKRNLHLINTPEEYKHCHYLPESYEIIKEHTPKSVFLPVDENFDFEVLPEILRVFKNKPLVLKDYVKSRKHEWKEACFIPAASDLSLAEKIVRRFLELQGEDLNEGLVFREFIEFKPLTEHSKSGMPLTREFRLFFFEKELIFTSEYWEEGIYAPEDFPGDVFSDVAKNVQSNFFTMDVAQKTDGEWMIVELGDGQVAGLPESVDASRFYESLGLTPHELWRQDDNGHKFLIETYFCKADAIRARREFEARLHKQTYWIKKVL